MLTQQHTEIRGSHRTSLVLICQIDQRKARTGRNKETVLFTVIFYSKHQLIFFRLCDFVDFSARKSMVQFPCHAGDDGSVKCHINFLTF